jgi:hypothetical protein
MQNVEAQEMADNLRATARAMDESEKKLKEFGRKHGISSGTIIVCLDIEITALTLNKWANAIEAEYCGGDEA